MTDIYMLAALWLGLALGLDSLAAWADSEAVLPVYVMGMVLAGEVGRDHALVHRLRTLTFGLLTPVLLHTRGVLHFGAGAERIRSHFCCSLAPRWRPRPSAGTQ